jgi:hypothetical protein
MSYERLQPRALFSLTPIAQPDASSCTSRGSGPRPMLRLRALDASRDISLVSVQDRDEVAGGKLTRNSGREVQDRFGTRKIALNGREAA